MSTPTTRTFLSLGPGGLSLESEPTTEAEWREQFEGVRWLRDGFAFSSSDIHFLLEECGLRGEIKRIAPGHTRIYVPAGSALLCLSLQGWLAEQMPADALIDVVQEVAPMGETMPPATFAGVPFPYGGRVHVGVDTAKSDDESAGAWIIHHPSKGGPSSGLREVLTEAAIFGVSSARSLSTPATVAKLPPSTSRARDLPRTVGNRKARRAEVARRRTGR